MIAAKPQADGQQEQASGSAGNRVGNGRGNLSGEVSLGPVRHRERRKTGPGTEAHDRRAKPHEPVPGKQAVTGKQAAVKPHPVSYTHLRAHETRHDLVCRLLLEKKKNKKKKIRT